MSTLSGACVLCALWRGGRAVAGDRLAQPSVCSGRVWRYLNLPAQYGALVTEDYNTPHGKFTGEISWVRIDIGNDTFEDAAGKQAALAGRRGLRRRRRRPDAAKWRSSRLCAELRRACLNKEELGEQGEGNCRRYRRTCR